MRITDYENVRNLSDVGLVLTKDEAEELYIYLHKMLSQPDLNRAYLSECSNRGIEKELTIAIEEPGQCVAHEPMLVAGGLPLSA